MSYAIATDLVGLIPSEWLTEATDDTGDGTRDTIADVLQAAHDEVDSKIATRYTLPLDLSNTTNGIVAKLRHITRYIASAIAYGRRGMHKEFPWVDQLKDIRKQLDAIENGSLQLFPTLKQTNDDAEAITVTNRAHSNNLSC